MKIAEASRHPWLNNTESSKGSKKMGFPISVESVNAKVVIAIVVLYEHFMEFIASETFPLIFEDM